MHENYARVKENSSVFGFTLYMNFVESEVLLYLIHLYYLAANFALIKL